MISAPMVATLTSRSMPITLAVSARAALRTIGVPASTAAATRKMLPTSRRSQKAVLSAPNHGAGTTPGGDDDVGRQTKRAPPLRSGDLERWRTSYAPSGDCQKAAGRAVYPALATAATSSSTPTVAGLWSISMREEAKCTFTAATPSTCPTCFSIFATHDGHEKPSARRIVRVVAVVIVLMFLSLSDRGYPLPGCCPRR